MRAQRLPPSSHLMPWARCTRLQVVIGASHPSLLRTIVGQHGFFLLSRNNLFLALYVSRGPAEYELHGSLLSFVCLPHIFWGSNTSSYPRLFRYIIASYITALTYIYKSRKVTEVAEMSSISVASYIIAIFFLILFWVFGLVFSGFFFHPVHVIDWLRIPVWNRTSLQPNTVALAVCYQDIWVPHTHQLACFCLLFPAKCRTS